MMVPATVDSLSMTILLWVLNAVIFGSALALCTWALLSTALRGARPALHAVFWIVVLVKFLAPHGPSWQWSLSSLLAQVTPALPAAAPAPVEAEPLFVELVPQIRQGIASNVGKAHLELAAKTSNGPPAPAVATSAFPWAAAVAGAYLLAVAGMAAWRIRSYQLFAARCRRYPLGGRGVRRMVSRLCRRSGVRRPPIVRMSDDAVAPFIFGFFRPTLVLSRRTAMSGAELEAVMLHEIAHLRRFDLITRYVQWIAGTVLFFWPVVAWVNRRIDLAREHACDEWALRHGRLSAGEYARCLLAACSPRTPWSAYRPAAMAANVKHVERRIDMILELPARSRSRRILGLGAGAGALAWGAFVLTGATAAPPQADEEFRTARVAVFVSQDGEVHQLALPPGEDAQRVMMLAGTDGKPRVFQRARTAQLAGGVDGSMVFRFERELSPDALAAFGERYPAADADGDGLISLEERDAYLVALALSAPDAVLESFPHVDLDGDGELSIAEAAQWVTGPSGMPGVFNMNPIAAAGGLPGAANVFSLSGSGAAEGGPQIIVKAIASLDDIQPGPEGHPNIMVKVAAKADGETPADLQMLGGDARVILRHTGTGHPGDTQVVMQPIDGVKNEIRIEAIDGQPPMIWINGEPAEVADLQGADLSFELPSESGKLIKVLAKQVDGANCVALSEHVHDVVARFSAEGETAETIHKVLKLTGDGVDAKDLRKHITMFMGAGVPDAAVSGGIPDGAVNHFLFRGGMGHGLGQDVASWLTANIDADVSADEVAEYIFDVRQAPLDAFLRMHPDADYDGDGVLTERERARYIEAMTSRGRQAFLERHPEADADGDGLLTDVEMRAFFAGRQGSADSTPPIMRIIRSVVSDENGPESDD